MKKTFNLIKGVALVLCFAILMLQVTAFAVDETGGFFTIDSQVTSVKTFPSNLGMWSSYSLGYIGADSRGAYYDKVDENVVIKFGTFGENSTINGGFCAGYYGKVPGLVHRWEVSVKLPSVETGAETYVLGYNYNKSSNCSVDNAICLKNGGVYVGSENIATTALVADKWYKIVRIMDFSTQKKQMQKVFVYDGDTLVGSTGDDLIAAGTLDIGPDNYSTLTSNQHIICAFKTTGYTGTKPVEIDDVFACAASPTATISTTQKNKFVSLTPNGNDVYSRSIGEKNLTLANGNYNRYTASFMMPVLATAEGNFAELITPTDTNGLISSKEGMDINGATAVVKNDKLYVRVLNDVENPGVSTNWSDVEITGVSINPNTWYTIVREYDIRTGISSFYIYDEDGVELGKKENYQTKIQTKTAGNNFAVAYLNACKHDTQHPVYMDNIRFEVMTGGFDGTKNVNIYRDFEVEGQHVGKSLVEAGLFTATNSFNTNWYSTTFRYTTILEASDIATGKIKTINPGTIEINFDTDVTADSINTNTIELLENGLSVESSFYDVEYDADTKSALITFNDTLLYDSEYTINVSGVIRDDAYGTHMLPQTFVFSTPEVAYKINSRLFVDAAEEEFPNELLKKGDVIKAKVNISNLTSEEQDYLVILAVYDGNSLSDAKTISGTLSGNAKNVPIETQSITVAEDGCRASIFVWDSWTNMTPVIGAIRLPE